MSMQSVALASLTATYTDSEGEDGADDYEDGSNTPRQANNEQAQSNQSQASQSPKSDHRSTSNSPSISTPNSKQNDAPNSISTDVSNKVHRLVSYFDDTVLSDDEGPIPSASEVALPINGNVPLESAKSRSPVQQESFSDEEADEYGVKIPKKPGGQCPIQLQEKISKLYDKMESGRLDMNKLIQQRKDFRNPSIYEKLIQFCKIDELGTNYSKDRFDPGKWGSESYYDELAKAQKIEMEKLEKARKEKAKCEIVSGTAKRPANTGVPPAPEEDAKKRKSKWDQIPPNPVSVKQSVVVTQQSINLTASVTGTKATVISAFGSLPKKRL